jgi:hypothetical protein
MTHYKYSPKQNLKFNPQTARVFRQNASKGILRNNIKNKKTNNFTNGNKFDLLNLVFISAGIFSIISLGLIFTPNIMTTKIVKAQIPKAPSVTIVTNFNSQEYKSNFKSRSFLQPVQAIEVSKK